MPPHHLRCYCLHEQPPLGSPLAGPTTRYSPARNRPSPHYTPSMHIRRSASTRSQRQLPPMHAAYRRGPALSAAPSLRDSVPATPPHHLRCHFLHAQPPLGLPLAGPTTRYSLARHHPTRNTHHPRTAGVRKNPLTTPAAADARSVPLRCSVVSCAILPRLGASDAAPSSSM
jgi:hypothetical protein